MAGTITSRKVNTPVRYTDCRDGSRMQMVLTNRAVPVGLRLDAQNGQGNQPPAYVPNLEYISTILHKSRCNRFHFVLILYLEGRLLL